MNIKAALKGQYRGALAMLKDCMEHCPAELWNDGEHPVPFWRVVYHTLYFTHLYLQQTEADFRPWDLHREEYHDLPWPAESGQVIEDPYTKQQLLDYWRIIDARLDADVDRMDLDAKESGFPWHKMIPKLDHQIHSIRHIQHHAAMLSGRLRAAHGADIRWVRAG